MRKFCVAQAFALCWLGASVWLSLAWLRELGSVIGLLPAVLVISLIAYLPGWLVAFSPSAHARTTTAPSKCWWWDNGSTDGLPWWWRPMARAFAFVTVYQLLMSPISVAGYAQELLGLRRRWK